MSRTVSVTFTTQPARGSTRRGAGAVLEYEMVISVEIGGQPALRFKPPNYDRWALTSAQPGQRRYDLPAAMARHLGVFVQTCFVQGRQGYSGFRFMDYMVGYTTSPTAQNHRVSEVELAHGSRITPGTPYMIVGNDRSALQGVIGLEPWLTLGVNGLNADLAICPIRSLIRAYGGTSIYEVTGLQTTPARRV